jgi:hypothetical protein
MGYIDTIWFQAQQIHSAWYIPGEKIAGHGGKKGGTHFIDIIRLVKSFRQNGPRQDATSNGKIKDPRTQNGAIQEHIQRTNIYRQKQRR